MATPERNTGEPVWGISITTVDAVPIIPAYLEIMTRILGQHGATLTETEEAPPKNVDPLAKMYTVMFPPGTVRVDGVLIHRSFPFVIHFPDGYALNGAQLWPMTLCEGDSPIHALYLSDSEVKP